MQLVTTPKPSESILRSFDSIYVRFHFHSKPKKTMSKRRLLHFLMTRELKQRRAALAEEIQRCIRIQHFDGVLQRWAPTSCKWGYTATPISRVK